jgi:hypothetical protein
MRTFLIAALAAVTLATPAKAATRNFGITGFDRIRVEGPFEVRLANGVAPFARADGSPAAIDRVAIDVQGSTLVVRTNPSWGGYPGKDFGSVAISLGTHELSSAWLRGAGSLMIDKVKALKFVLSVEGAGAASLDSADVDQLRVTVSGSGSATVGGRAGKFSAAARGVGVIDATALSAKDADIGAEGPATVKATVGGDANVAASGVSSVILAGKPACTTTLTGSASVTGCR